MKRLCLFGALIAVVLVAFADGGRDTTFLRTQERIINLNEVKVVHGGKVKSRKLGKSKNRGFARSFYQDKKGSMIGFEVKRAKKKDVELTAVGFHILDAPNMLSKADFRIRIYEIGDKEKGMVMRNVVPVSDGIIMHYKKEDIQNGMYRYVLPEPIVVPPNSMVAIELLQDIHPEVIPFKTNIFGKSVWITDSSAGEWLKMPFALPFFVETAERKRR